MLTYITAFIFYTLAMIGILMVAFIIYKKTTLTSPKTEGRGMIRVIDSVQISPKKSLLVVKVKGEKFLIASGLEHTTFLAKLDDSNLSAIDEEILQHQIKQNHQQQVDTRAFVQENLNTYTQNPEDNFRSIQEQFRNTYAQKPIENKTTKDLNLDENLLKQARAFVRNMQEKNMGNSSQQSMDRKDAIRQLINEINETTKAGSYN